MGHKLKNIVNLDIFIRRESFRENIRILRDDYTSGIVFQSISEIVLSDTKAFSLEVLVAEHLCE